MENNAVVKKHHCIEPNAAKMLEWIKTRGGLALWRSVNLSNPGESWTTPALTEDGQPYPKPTWEADSKPYRVITDASEVLVVIPKEVKRFHVAVRRGSEGLSFKLTDASSRKVRDAWKKFSKPGFESWYEFDYDTQEAVIFVPEKQIPLSEYNVPEVKTNA